MPSESVLLPLCIAVAIAFVVLGVILWMRGRKGRALRAVAVAAGVIGLYLTGLLTLVWNAVVTLGRWAQSLVFNTTVWAGAGLLALMVVLWIVGGYLKSRRVAAKARGELGTGRQKAVPASGTHAAPASSRASGAKTDTEDDEIEALLRKRGIQ